RGCMGTSAFSMATESPTDCRGAAAPAERPHNPCRQADAGARSAVNPHAACDAAGTGNGITVTSTRARKGKPGHSQGAAYGLPRQFPTLPGEGFEKVVRKGPNVLRTHNRAAYRHSATYG